MFVSFKIFFGGVQFEIIVEYCGKRNIKFFGDINRMNKYGDQVKCIKFEEKFYRLYCLCFQFFVYQD